MPAQPRGRREHQRIYEDVMRLRDKGHVVTRVGGQHLVDGRVLLTWRELRRLAREAGHGA